MSKYIIDTGNYLFTTDGVLVVGFDCDNKPDTCYEPLSDLEELNSDYINEHFGELQDEAYQRGYEDGKWKAEDGCTGCKYEGNAGEHLPCEYCMNNFKNQWTAKQKDRIEVGDEVDWNGDCFVVTRIYQPLIDKRCNGIAKDGSVYMDVVYDRLTKTGRHFDIASILEAMRE